ncbi:COMM domain-containing protein 7-like [Trichogramma pretiosum]|uniref:COMM domain-containing protein n=1 Tax=Trichogramma kaykai TaxID=54128 RepID=A0ABD2XFP5_9HYME|nr:COMM domain-containing protein 7-like [Trichogramma pretiosum]
MDDVPVNNIVDFSWRFGVTIASGISEEVGKNFVQVEILYDEEGKRKTFFVEMSVNQFHKLIYDLEKVKSNLDILM